MTRRIKPLPGLAGDQASAANPHIHASLSASAGTGKTQVLTARVLRLLLSGVDPDTILCLTFTKAGAAEMTNRIGERLAAWVRMRDQDLRSDLVNIGEDTSPPTLERARRLFARVLDAPGGLRVQTIHSFAQTLLAAFPAEAGVTPGLVPIEGRAEQELARRTLARLVGEAEAVDDRRLVEDLQRLSVRVGEASAERYLMQCSKAAGALAELGPAETVEDGLRAMLGLPDGNLDALLADRCSDGSFDCDLLRAVADINRQWGGVTGTAHVERIERWLAMGPRERAAQLPELALLVFTGAGEPRKVTSGQTKIDPDYQAHADALAGTIAEILDIKTRQELLGDMVAGLRAGMAFARAYGEAKRSAGVADYDDLIAWTRELLAKPGMGEWVRYKLDRRTDHILVDESQDTNRAQWEIIEALAGEFFTGSSETERRHRTLFMVGDFKQAIFGFQGTDPREFDRARRWVRERSDALREVEDDEIDEARRRALKFAELSIDASFRSAPAILETVDRVMAMIGHEALGLPEPPNPHRAHFQRRPGRVELWAPFMLDQGEADNDNDAEEEGWLDERDRRYASALAGQVRDWLDEAPVLASTRRPLSAGDILILVRSRGELASLLVARLFEENVPVAGIDRLHLHKPLAVRDLLAAVAFAVQPLDDLNLANLLVSPLLGWSQEELLGLAFGRDGKPLWRVLGERAGENAQFRETRDQLNELLTVADYRTPHQFLETILSGPLDGRRKLYGRLDLSARDPIDELLSSALEFERSEVPSLERFLNWFATGDVEVKRDPSAPMNAVRVMTVHGAKGLEAPVVILADATSDPADLGGVECSIDLPLREGREVPLVRPRKSERVSPFAEVMAEQELRELEEHWRLLYVAMTRAGERLVVAGLDKGKHPASSWHGAVRAAMAELGAEPQEDSRWGSRLVYTGSVPQSAVRAKPPSPELAPAMVPDWARTIAPAETRPPRPLAPSAVAEDREPVPPPTAASRAAAIRGTLIHQLLERLADVRPESRRERALAWLERQSELAQEEQREITDTVCSILSHPVFGPLFEPGSLAEAPLAAVLDDGTVVAGTVDRLCIGTDQVLVIDFKTGRVPGSAADVPAAHRAQMEAYRSALKVIFPGRSIRAALLYTGGPRMIELGG